MGRNVHVLGCLAVLLALAWAQAGDLGDQDEPVKPKKVWRPLTPEQLVSDTTLFYITTSNFTNAKKAFLRSAFAGLLSEKAIEERLLQTLEELKKSYVEGGGAKTDFEIARKRAETDLLEKVMKDYLLEHVSLAVDLPGGGAGAPAAAPGAVVAPRWMVILSIPTDDNPDLKQEQLIGLVEDFALRQLQDARFSDHYKKVGEYEVQGLSCPQLNLHESWAFVENLFIYGQGQGIVEEAVTNYAVNRGKGTLSQFDGYHAAIRRVGDRAQLYVQLDASQTINKFLASQGLDALAAANLGDLAQSRPQLALGAYVMDGEQAPIREKVLLAAKHQAPPDVCAARTAYLASSDTLIYHAFTGNLQGLFKPSTDWLATQPAGTPFKGAMSELQAALEAANEEEVWNALRPFNGEMAVLVNYLPGENLKAKFQEIFQVVFAVEIQEAELANATDTLDRLRRATQLEYKKVSYLNYEMYYQLGALPDEVQRGGRIYPLLDPIVQMIFPSQKPQKRAEGKPFFVSHAIVKPPPATPDERERTFLLLSDNIEALKRTIHQLSMPHQSLARRAEFQAQIKEFNPNRHAVTWLDLPRLSDATYHQILPALVAEGLLDKEDYAEIPSDELIRSHLSPMLWATSAPNEGNLYEFVSPTGNLPLLGLIGALAVPTINRAKERRISEEITNNFRQIGLAIHLYNADFDRFPERLQDLVPNYIPFTTFKDVFNSPFNPNMVMQREDVDDPKKTNLIYRPGQHWQDLSEGILLYEVNPTMLVETQFGTQSTLHHVLQLNAQVRPKTMSNIQRILNKELQAESDLEKPKAAAPKKK